MYIQEGAVIWRNADVMLIHVPLSAAHDKQREIQYLNDVLMCMLVDDSADMVGWERTGMKRYGTWRSYSSQVSPYLALHFWMSRRARCAIMQQKKTG